MRSFGKIKTSRKFPNLCTVYRCLRIFLIIRKIFEPTHKIVILIALPGEERLMSLSSFCSYKQIMDVGKDSDDNLEI